MMLPDELEWVLEMLGYRWPTADEDKLRDSAALWREFGEKVNGLHTTANTSARQVLAHNAGESIDKFSKTYEKFDGGGGDGYLQNAAQAAFIIANVMEACAYLVEFAKWAVIAQLIALAIEIVAAHAAAPFTFGLSEVAGLGATQVTRLIVRRLLDELKKALMEAIVEAMKEPAISAIEAIITDLIRQTVNVGFGAQEGYDVSATIKAGGQAGLDALKQTPQTLAEGVRDSLGQKAGNKFHHAVDSRIDGYNGPSSNGLGADGAGGDGGDTGKSDGDSGSNSSNSSSDSNSSSNSSSDSGSRSSSDSGSSRSSDSSSDSPSTRSTNDVGSNIGRGISADTGGNDIGGPDVGAGPDSGPGSDSGRDSSSSDSSYPRPTGSSSGPSLSDFDDPSPSGPSSSAGDGNGSFNSPSSSGTPSNSGGGSHVSGLSSPTAHSAPTPSSSGGTSSSPGNGAIGTSIDSLAATTPTQSNAAPTTATADPSPSSSGGRSDGGSAIPSSPVASAAAAGGGAGSHHGGGASGGGSPSATSPTPNSGPARNPSAANPSPTGTGPASTPSPTAGTGPRSTPATTPASTPASTPTSDGRGAGAGARSAAGNAAGSTASNTAGNASANTSGNTTPGGDRSTPRNAPGTTPGDRTSPQSTPGDRTAPRNTPGTTATPGDGSTPRNTPGNTTPGDRTTPHNTPGNTNSGDRTTPRNTPDSSSSTRTHTPGQDPRTTTPNQTPSHSNPSQSNPSQSNPSRSNPSQSNPTPSTPSRTSPPSTSPNTNTTTPSTSTGTGPDRSSTPNSGTPSNSNPSTPSNRTPNASNPSTPSNQPGPATNHPTQGAPSTPGTPSTPNQPSASPTPNKPPHQPTGSTPNTPQQPAAHPDKPENSQQNPDQQQQQQVTPVPIHTVVTTPPPSHADPTAPQNPGSPQAAPNDPGNQHHPNQDSLDDIRADLDHYPGGLTEPDPADQQALADAVPRNEDGTPERFPDPHGPWSQLQNDGGNTVPGRSNNCADCSRSFLETWYGNPQVSAPRTVDTDANGNPDYWSPEDNANDNQIRWTGASHTYAGPGGDPNTANNIASVLQQSGPGSAAIVQVDWPGGGGHAFNVVNHDGNIVWIDTQSGDVSDQPLHLDQAEHVWHIPLDANRNPIDLSQPDATDSNQGTDASQEGTDSSQDGPDTTQDGTDSSQNEPDTTQDGPDNSQQEPDDNANQSSDDSKPDSETVQPDPKTSEDGPDSTQQMADDSPDTSHSQKQNENQQTNESDPSTEPTDDNPSDNSDATKPESPDTTQSESPDSTKPTDPEPSQTKDQDSADPENAETSQPKDPDPTQSENPDTTQSENPDTTQTGHPDSEAHTDPDSNPPTDPDSSPPSTDPDGSDAKDPDAAESTDPDHTTPEDSADGSPQDPSHPDPLPATATRDTTPPGGVTHPTPAEQQSLENSVPRDENGDPIRPPDPADGPWVRNINGDGADSPGRNNNCTDVALSTVDTYAGNPTAAAARTPDPNPDGTPSDRGEKAGRDRIENTLGARFSDMGNGRDAFNRLENTLRNSGHGSQAVIITQDANGRAHAWNAVNHNGRVTYIDAQTGQQSSKPLHNGNNGVFAIPLDSNRQPVTPNRSGVTDSTSPDTNRSNPRSTSESSADSPRRPSAEPGGQPSDAQNADGKDKKAAGLEPHPDDSHPRLEREFGDNKQQQGNLDPDDSQQRVRQTNPVFRVQPGHVDQQLRDWAKNGQLAHVLNVASGSESDPNVSPDRPRTFTSEGLNKALPGFESLNRGEKMQVISTLARLSQSAHEQYGVNSNPMDNGQESEGAAKHKTPGERVRRLMTKLGVPETHTPDLTQRNFAVVELQRDDGTIEYVTDSSFPSRAGVAGLHSERHLADWIDDVNKANESTGHNYKIAALYTEREPCGDKKGGLGSSNCSNLLGERLAGVPVYYSTTYRADPADQQRSELTRDLQKQRRTELGLDPRAALPDEEKKKITAEVKKKFPVTANEKARDREMVRHVKKIEELWKTTAPQLK
ncbi:toxin glutamine deamidase domain-containing protein [Streptomyces chartreusis]